MSTLTAIEQEYAQTHSRLEELRIKSRAARKQLIDAIVCDEKDVLADSDLNQIETAMAQFLEVQKDLGKAFFENANAAAKFMWEAGGDAPTD